MKRTLRAGLTALLFLLLLTSCGSGGGNKVYEVSDMAGKIVGVVSYTTSAGYIARFSEPVEIRYFDDAAQLKAALKAGSIDCALADPTVSRRLTRGSFSLRRLDDMFVDCDYRLAVSVENRELLANLNTALRSLSADGTADRIVDAWQSGEQASEHTPDPDRTPITVAIDPTFYPYAYYDAEGEPAGLEIDIVWAVCDKLGLTPEFVAAQPGMPLYLAEIGKTAFAIGRISLDPDNEAVSFTDAYMHCDEYVVVRK